MKTGKWLRLLIAGTLAAALAGCGGGSKTADPGSAAPGPDASGAGGRTVSAGDAAQGQAVFQGTCASCHGADARGMPGLGKDLVASAFVREQDDQQLLEFLKMGRPASDPANTTKVDMPPRGGNPALTDEDLKNVIAYIRTLQGGK